MNTKFRYFLRSLLPSACFIFIQNGAAVFSMQLLLIAGSLRYKGDTYDGFIEYIIKEMTSATFLRLATLIASAVGVALFAFWYFRLIRAMNPKKYVFEIGQFSLRQGIMMGVFALATQYVSCFIVLFLGLAFPEWADQYERLQELSGFSTDHISGMLLFDGIVLAPICEELCLRGVTYNYAKLAMPARSANIVQAVIFAGLHGNPIQSIYTFIIGMAFGKIYESTGHIAYPILIHMIFNACGLLLSRYIFLGNTPVTFYLILFSALMCAYLSFNWMIRDMTERKEMNDKKDAE